MAEVTIIPKGQAISIKEKAPALTKLHVGMGWDTNEEEGGNPPLYLRKIHGRFIYYISYFFHINDVFGRRLK